MDSIDGTAQYNTGNRRTRIYDLDTSGLIDRITANASYNRAVAPQSFFSPR